MSTAIENLYKSVNGVNVQLTNQEKELKRLRMVEAKFNGLKNTNAIYRNEIIAYKDVNERSQKLICEKDTEIKRLNEKIDYLKAQNFKPVSA